MERCTELATGDAALREQELGELLAKDHPGGAARPDEHNASLHPIAGRGHGDEVQPFYTRSMDVKVRLFAGLKELVGGDIEEHFEGPATVADLTQRLASTRPALKPFFEVLAVAVNQEYVVDRSQELRDGDEVALIQPISGGAESVETPHYLVTALVLGAGALRAAVLTPASGAVVLFEGVVRDRHEGHPVLRLEYEAYVPMAEKVLRQVGESTIRDFDVHDVAIHHRIGTLEVGETSLIVAVSAEHRAQAFEAAHAAVDRVKESVPVWKREYGPDGATWQEGVPPRPIS
jgi:molybdopterin synthase catalytic subunit